MKLFIYNFFEKIKTDIKNVTSRKLKETEQSHLEARFATPESTLTAPNYRFEKFKI